MEACQPIYHDLRKVLAFLDADGVERSGSVTDSRQWTTRPVLSATQPGAVKLPPLSSNYQSTDITLGMPKTIDSRITSVILKMSYVRSLHRVMSRSSYRTTTPSVFQVV